MIHVNDPLIGREWDLVCFICREVSYLGPSFGCVESFGEVVVCARCHSANAPLPAERVARIHSSPVLNALTNEQLTWMPLPPVDDDPDDTTKVMCRLARAGLDAHARAYYNSLPYLQQEAVNIDSVLAAAIVGDRDELVAWMLDHVAVDSFGWMPIDLLRKAYSALAVRCIALLRARCSLPAIFALDRLSRNDDIPMALLESLLAECKIAKDISYPLAEVFARVAERFGNGAVAVRLLEFGAETFRWGGTMSSVTLRTIISALSEKDLDELSSSVLDASMCLPPDVCLLREMRDIKETSDREICLASLCRNTRSVDMVRAVGRDGDHSDKLESALEEALSIGALNVAEELLALATDARQLLASAKLPQHAVRGGARALAWLFERSNKSQSAKSVQDALFEAADLTDLRRQFVLRGGVEGVIDVFRALREHGADLHALNSNGENVLFVACKTSGGDSAARPVLEALLGAEFGLDAKIRSEDGQTLLHVTRDPVIFKRLMDVLDINAETCDQKKKTPLRAACRAGAVDIARLLLAAGVCVTEEAVDDAFAAPHWSIVRLLEGRHRFAVTHLRHHDLPLDIAHRALIAGTSAQAVVRRRDAVLDVSHGMLRLLLAHNVEVPLDGVARRSRSVKSVCAMLGAGFEPTESALLGAMQHSLGILEPAYALVACGARCNNASAIADFGDHVEILRVLIAAGLDVQQAVDLFPEKRANIEEALQREPLVLDDVRAAIDRSVRQMSKTRFVVERLRMLEICVALQSLRWPALVTTTVLDQTSENAAQSPLHWKWFLVTTVKHFKHI